MAARLSDGAARDRVLGPRGGVPGSALAPAPAARDRALAAARACPGPLYNRYYDGGFLIWFAPERRVFIDSRQDPYPVPFLLEALRVEQGAPPEELFARWAIRCALLPVASPVHARVRD